MSDIEDPKLTRLYQRSQTEQPSDFSDSLIKKAARKAVKQQRHSRWVVGWSVAATFVLGIAITSHLLMPIDPKLQQLPSEESDAIAPMSIAPVQESFQADMAPMMMRSAPVPVPAKASAMMKRIETKSEMAKKECLEDNESDDKKHQNCLEDGKDDKKPTKQP